MKIIDLSYSQFKSLITSKGMLGQYKETATTYDLFAIEDGVISWETCLAKDSSDATDFENNFKATYNKPLEIKAGPGRPMRVSASPQPINTTQKFKGYQITVPANETSATLDISFPQDVYIKGGTIWTATTFATNDTVSLDGVFTAYNLVVIPNIIDGVFLPSTINRSIEFISPESMYLATAFSLRVTLDSPDGEDVATARTLNIIITYYM